MAARDRYPEQAFIIQKVPNFCQRSNTWGAKGRLFGRSENAVAFVNVTQQEALEQFVSCRVLRLHLLEGAGQHSCSLCLGDYDDTINVAENEITRMDQDPAALDRRVHLDHAGPPLGV